jgi:tetratricopeptide (TPR) repeat protein
MVAMFDQDWLRAGREFREAEELNPNLGTPDYFHLWMGNLDDAVEAVEREMTRMDMTTGASHLNRGWAFLFCREYERAIQHARKCSELQPRWSSPYHLLGQIYHRLGRHDEAVDALSRFLSLNFNLSADVIAGLERSYEKEGIEAFWNQYLELFKPRWTRDYDISVVYGKVGEKDAAFKWLEKMCQMPLHHPFPPDPQMDPLRDDPRFEELLRKLNLPEEAIQRHLALPGG